MGVYASIRTWLQPYWRARPRGARRRDDAIDNSDAKIERSVNGDPALKCAIYNYTGSGNLSRASQMIKKPDGNKIFCYHDAKVMQVFAHFERGQGFDHQKRDDAARKQLEPLIYPKGVQYDRTHLIPIGYHGSENDKRLLVGWDSSQNRNEMADFEKRAKALNKKVPIWWLTSISRIPGGLRWQYRIYDATDQKSTNPTCRLHLDLDYPCEYVWRAK